MLDSRGIWGKVLVPGRGGTVTPLTHNQHAAPEASVTFHDIFFITFSFLYTFSGVQAK